MRDKLVSVNITTYNRVYLLQRCLDSVLSQSYKNLELIIVDDCSTDNTEKIVKEYQKKDDRIKYFKHQKNLGNAYARNTGLEKCTGYYVAFMDDDDEWIDKDKIKKQVEIFENNKSKKLGIICSSVRLYSDEKNYKDKIIKKPKNLKEHILARNGIIYSPTVMTKRDIMIEVDGFDVNLPRGVDSDFYRICIVKYGYDVYFMKDVTTGIHEYGEDRMTKLINCNGILIHISSQSYNIRKYFVFMIKYPKSCFLRVKIIFKLYIEYIKCIFFKREKK